MNKDQRKAGDYEIIHALHIGDREIVVGENPASTTGEKYMCAFCEQNPFFARYDEVMVSNDYAEIIGLYGQRVAEQAEKTRLALLDPKLENVPNGPLGVADCIPLSGKDDLNQKIVVIRADVLRREYQRAANQIALCVGGFGASPNSRGSACYCVKLYSGETARYERQDILGILKEEFLPKWARQGLLDYQQKQQQKQRAGPANER